MPTDPEVKTTITPSGENPATTPPQEASKVENSQNDLTAVEQVGKIIVDETFKKIQEKNNAAERRLQKEREDVIKQESQKAIQEQIESIARDPVKNKVDFLVQAGELPQDKDLQLVVISISKTITNNDNLFETDTVVPVMDQWIRLLSAAGKDKSDDVRMEIEIYKKRLAQKIKEVAMEKGRREDEKSNLSDEKRQVREARRMQFADKWATYTKRCGTYGWWSSNNLIVWWKSAFRRWSIWRLRRFGRQINRWNLRYWGRSPFVVEGF